MMLPFSQSDKRWEKSDDDGDEEYTPPNPIITPPPLVLGTSSSSSSSSLEEQELQLPRKLVVVAVDQGEVMINCYKDGQWYANLEDVIKAAGVARGGQRSAATDQTLNLVCGREKEKHDDWTWLRVDSDWHKVLKVSMLTRYGEFLLRRRWITESSLRTLRLLREKAEGGDTGPWTTGRIRELAVRRKRKQRERALSRPPPPLSRSQIGDGDTLKKRRTYAKAWDFERHGVDADDDQGGKGKEEEEEEAVVEPEPELERSGGLEMLIAAEEDEDGYISISLPLSSEDDDSGEAENFAQTVSLTFGQAERLNDIHCKRIQTTVMMMGVLPDGHPSRVDLQVAMHNSNAVLDAIHPMMFPGHDSTMRVPRLPPIEKPVRVSERIVALGYDRSKVTEEQYLEIGRQAAQFYRSAPTPLLGPWKIVAWAGNSRVQRHYYSASTQQYIDDAIVNVLGEVGDDDDDDDVQLYVE